MAGGTGGTGNKEPFRLRMDPVTGDIGIEVFDFWTADESVAFTRRLTQLIRTARQCTPNLKVLVDARRMKVHSNDDVTKFRHVDTDLYRAADRIAVVTGAALLRMQFRRIFNVAETNYFDNGEDAHTWLYS